MFTETLYPKTKQVLTILETFPITKSFYLAGGTALALHLGHRKSSDLDWFTADYPTNNELLKVLKPLHPTITETAPTSLNLLIDTIKVTFWDYDYPLLQPTAQFENIKLASVIDIACMKITAISSRSSKKDFVDLYAVLQDFSLDDLLHQFEKKYQSAEYNKLHILKSLTYFTDADSDPDPDYMEPIDWETVKSFLTTATQAHFNQT